MAENDLDWNVYRTPVNIQSSFILCGNRTFKHNDILIMRTIRKQCTIQFLSVGKYSFGLFRYAFSWFLKIEQNGKFKFLYSLWKYNF